MTANAHSPLLLQFVRSSSGAVTACSDARTILTRENRHSVINSRLSAQHVVRHVLFSAIAVVSSTALAVSVAFAQTKADASRNLSPR